MHVLMQAHLYWSYVVIGLAAICGIWGSILWFMKRAVNRPFSILLGIVAGVGLLQGLLGGILFLQGDRPGQPLHYLYGALVIFVVPAAYSYASGKRTRRDTGIFALATLFLAGLAVRALLTGPGH